MVRSTDEAQLRGNVRSQVELGSEIQRGKIGTRLYRSVTILPVASELPSFRASELRGERECRGLPI